MADDDLDQLWMTALEVVAGVLAPDIMTDTKWKSMLKQKACTLLGFPGNSVLPHLFISCLIDAAGSQGLVQCVRF
jgi:hypothetical protein